MKIETTGNNLKFILIIFPVMFLFLLFYVPLGVILYKGLSDNSGRPTFFYIAKVLTSSYYRGIVGFTFYQAVLSALFSILLGLPGAFLLSNFAFPGKSIVKGITSIPFVLPPILVVLGFVLVFGNNGALNRMFMGITGKREPVFRILYSMKAILLAHVFYNFPVAVRLLSSVWSRVPHTEVDAARTLGAGKFRAFLTVTFPQLFPGFIAAFSLIFLYCFMSFAVILVLGGGPKFTTLEVEIYRLAKTTLDINAAGALALIGSMISLLSLYGYLKIQDFFPGHSDIYGKRELKPLSALFNGIGGIMMAGYILVVVLLIISPVAAVIIRSFQMRSGWSGAVRFSFKWYKNFFTPGSVYGRVVFTSLKNSLVFGFSTTFLSLLLGTLIAYILHQNYLRGRRIIDTLVMLPLGVSPVILGLGYLKTMQYLPEQVRGGGVLIVFAHTIAAYPFVIRSVSAGLKKIHPSLESAALTLGAPPGRVFRTIFLPLLKPGLFAGAAFSFAISAGEMNATIILAGDNTLTIPIAMYRFISSYNYFAACAAGVFLILLCASAFLFIDTLGEVGE